MVARSHPTPDPSSSAVQEQTLVERIAEGDERAFEQLFDAQYAALCDFAASYVRAPDIAEEIVQTVFLRIWERRRTWEPTGGVRAYLFTACRNAAFDYLSHESVVRRTEVTAASAGDVPALGYVPRAPDDAAMADELTNALRAAVEALPERQRAVMMLRWQHQLGPTEIARVLGITVKGVESHVLRALADLRQQLAKFR